MNEMKRRLQVKKEDCGQEMTKQQMRSIQIEMLDALAQFCDAHGLRYYLSGGTLLGAIRHKGFIPWDDDIDINMPRPDCRRLMELTNGVIGDFVVTMPDQGELLNSAESLRMYSLDAVVETFHGGAARIPSYMPLFIDIFPIEGLPEQEFATRLHYGKLVFARKMMRVSSLKHMEGSNLAAHVFHVLAMIPAKLVGYQRWSRRIQKIAETYKFDDQKYIGVMTAPVHTTNEKVLKEDYIKTVEVEFEGKCYHAPANYDVYLTQLYGNYMQLPPKEKQQSHHRFCFYWRKEDTYKR